MSTWKKYISKMYIELKLFFPLSFQYVTIRLYSSPECIWILIYFINIFGVLQGVLRWEEMRETFFFFIDIKYERIAG